MKDIILHKVTNKKGNSFVGLKMINDRVDFYYPETYNIDLENDKNLKEDILSILRSINNLDTNTDLYKEANTELIGVNSFSLSSYLWLINDYLKNGIYHTFETDHNLNNGGKVNWKQTFQYLPIVSNKKIIYNNLIREKSVKILDIISEIYIYALKISINRVGWLFNLQSDYLNESSNLIKINKYHVDIVKKELSKTFDDHKKQRLNHLLKIIHGIDFNSVSSSEMIFGVSSFNFVFESLIKSIFNTEKNLSQYFPRGSWQLKEHSYISKLSSSLKPDSLLLIDNSIIIIDAKNYRYSITGQLIDLPKTDSIQKQLTYFDFINNSINDLNNLYNIFLLPFNKSNQELSDFDYVGYASANWRSQLHSKLYNSETKIYAFLIDMKSLVKLKYSSDKKYYQRLLFEKVMETIDSQ